MATTAAGRRGAGSHQRLDPDAPARRTDPLAIVAGYVAFLSILLVPAPVSLVLGVCALAQLRRRPGAYGRGRAIFAIVMGALFTVALAGVVIAHNA